jgi:hypothetical protein
MLAAQPAPSARGAAMDAAPERRYSWTSDRHQQFNVDNFKTLLNSTVAGSRDCPSTVNMYLPTVEGVPQGRALLFCGPSIIAAPDVVAQAHFDLVHRRNRMKTGGAEPAVPPVSLPDFALTYMNPHREDHCLST